MHPALLTRLILFLLGMAISIAAFAIAPFAMIVILNLIGLWSYLQLPECRGCKSRVWVRPLGVTVVGDMPVFSCMQCHFHTGEERRFVRPEDEQRLRAMGYK